jgi:mannosyltransferase
MLFLLVLCAGVLARLYRLGWESLSNDEVADYFLSRMDFPAIFRALKGNVHPPLFFVTNHLWINLGDGPDFLRLFSVMFGALAVIWIWKFGREIRGQSLGLLAAALLALSPIHIFFSQEARMYSASIFLTAASSFYLYRMLVKPSASATALYFLASSLALFTHYFNAMTLLAQASFVLCARASGWIGQAEFKRWLRAAVPVALLFLCWLPFALPQAAALSETRGMTLFHNRAAPGLRDLGKVFLYLSSIRPAAGILVGLLILSSFRRGVGASMLGIRMLGFLLVVPVLTAFAIGRYYVFFMNTHLVICLPAFLLLVSAGITSIRHALIRIPVAVALLAVFSVNSCSMLSARQDSGWPAAVEGITREWRSGDILGFQGPGPEMLFRYYREQLLKEDPKLERCEPEIWIAPEIRLLGNATERASVLRAEINKLDNFSRLWMSGADSWMDPDGLVQREMGRRFTLIGARGGPGVPFDIYLLRRTVPGASSPRR